MALSYNSIMIIIDIPMFVFHLSIVLMVFVEKWKRTPEFKGGFFTIFLILAIMDSLSYLWVRLITRSFNSLELYYSQNSKKRLANRLFSQRIILSQFVYKIRLWICLLLYLFQRLFAHFVGV